MSGSLLTSVPDLSNYLGCKSKLKVIINRREIGHINGGDIRIIFCMLEKNLNI